VSQTVPERRQVEVVTVRNLVIAKWGSDTVSLFERNVKTDKPVDRLCITALSVSSTYCNAIMTLLANGLRMPTKALLRVLFELSVKLLWCLREPVEDESIGTSTEEAKSAREIIEQKVLRWEKGSIAQDIRLTDGFLALAPAKDQPRIQEQIAHLRKRDQSLTCKPVPAFSDIVRELPDVWGRDFYVRCYQQFNNAVHLDIGSLCRRVKKKNHGLAVECDSDESIERLAQHWVAIQHIILWTVRKHYEWDTDQMDEEFKALNKAGTV